jgi:CubicO group peptidase (beta-lactamase class C family)
MLIAIKNLINRTVIICLLGIFGIANVYGQSKFDKLTDSLHRIFLQDSLPGLSVVLVNSKKTIYEQNFGYADIDNKTPYTKNTIQNIGSVSKTLIAFALMKGLELGYFTLETNINDVLPFKVINPNHPKDIITIRELATHTSGIIDNPLIYPNGYIFYLDTRPYSKEALEAAHAIGYRQKLTDTSLAQFYYNYLDAKGIYYSADNFDKDKPGSNYVYSNIGSALAAYLIEIKSGMPYAEFTAKYIFKPLGMNNSGWSIASINVKKHAKLYYKDDLYFPLYNLLTYPDGGLKTSTSDLSKYLIGMINGYQGHSNLLTEQSFNTMFTPQLSNTSPPKGINLFNRNKGIFWNIYPNSTIGHDGDDPGVSTFLFFNTKTGLGGIFFCNKYLPNKQPIINLLLHAVDTPN